MTFLTDMVEKTPDDVRESYSLGLWQFSMDGENLAFQFFEDAPEIAKNRVMYYVLEAIKATPNKWFDVEGYEPIQ